MVSESGGQRLEASITRWENAYHLRAATRNASENVSNCCRDYAVIVKERTSNSRDGLCCFRLKKGGTTTTRSSL